MALKDFLHPANLGYRAGQVVARLTPEPVLYPVAETVGRIAAHALVNRRRVVARNLARVVDESELDQTVEDAFASYARYWAETLRIPAPGSEKIRDRTTHEGLDELSSLVDSGTGVIFVSAHLGSWDVAAAWVASHGWETLGVAERVKPEPLYDFFTQLRASVGVTVLPAGESRTARELISGLKRGAVVGLIADRDVVGSGIEVEFFGETTLLPSGPAVLALRLGLPLAVGALFQRPGGRWHAVVRPPVEVDRTRNDPQSVRDLTQRIASELEELIRIEPGQWHMFQPAWPSDPGYAK